MFSQVFALILQLYIIFRNLWREVICQPVFAQLIVSALDVEVQLYNFCVNEFYCSGIVLQFVEVILFSCFVLEHACVPLFWVLWKWKSFCFLLHYISDLWKYWTELDLQQIVVDLCVVQHPLQKGSYQCVLCQQALTEFHHAYLNSAGFSVTFSLVRVSC